MAVTSLAYVLNASYSEGSSVPPLVCEGGVEALPKRIAAEQAHAKRWRLLLGRPLDIAREVQDEGSLDLVLARRLSCRGVDRHRKGQHGEKDRSKRLGHQNVNAARVETARCNLVTRRE